MGTQYPAVLVDKVSRRRFFPGGFRQKPLIVSVGHKTDVLTVRLMGNGQPGFLRKAAALAFFHVTQRSQHMGKLALVQLVQHIALVLGGGGTPQRPPVSPLFHQGIVAGCHKVKAVFQGIVQQRPEFQIAVAPDTGVGGAAAAVFRHKVVLDHPGKGLGKVQNPMGDAQHPADGGSVLRFPQRAAGAVLLTAVQHHSHAGYLIPGTQKNERRRRTVHAAAHSQKNAIAHTDTPNIGRFFRFQIAPD